MPQSQGEAGARPVGMGSLPSPPTPVCHPQRQDRFLQWRVASSPAAAVQGSSPWRQHSGVPAAPRGGRLLRGGLPTF